MESRPRCLASDAAGIKLAACFGGIYLQINSQAPSVELGESDNDDIYVSQIVPFEAGERFVAIVGSRRGQHLKAWIVNKSNNTDITEMESIPKQYAGFGFAHLSTELNALFVATGLGLGVARVWKYCFESGQWELVLQCKARYNRILALHISPTMDLFVGTNDDHTKLCCQQWKIPTSAEEEEVMKKAKDVIAMFERKSEIREHTSEDFLQDVKDGSQLRMEPLQYVNEFPEEWSSVFPANAINPYAYVGEADEFGRANGKGKQLLAHNKMLFEGEFLNGNPTYGKLSKPRGFVYFGSVDETGMQHGYGEEHHYTTGREVEVYRGGFKHGMRHGMCEMQWKQTDSVKSSNHGLFLFAFYHEGKRHGLSWNIWHSTAPHTPFAQGKEREMRRELKTVGCIQAWNKGEYGDEFNFFCTTGREITTKDKRLLNVPEGAMDQPLSFQAKPQQGVYLGKYCWACTELTEEEDVVLVCLLCQMRVHAECAWPSEMFQTKWHSKLWTCRRCEVMFDCTAFLAHDRHRETVVVACEDDLDRLQHQGRVEVTLFAQRRPNAFDELMQDQQVQLK